MRRRGVRFRATPSEADWSGMAPVERKDLQPGDLLYFGESAKKITHTGVYLGDGKFIDATTWQTPMVRIDEPRRRPLVGAAGGDAESEMNRRGFLRTAAMAPVGSAVRRRRGRASRPGSCA